MDCNWSGVDCDWKELKFGVDCDECGVEFEVNCDWSDMAL